MAGCLLIFVIVVVIDVLTPQQLVAAILLNIPVALSGFTYKRRYTVTLLVGAIVVNAAVAVLNAKNEGGFDSITLFNRGLLAVSFVLVAFMTIQLSQTSSRLIAAKSEELRARRERDRERIAAVGQERNLNAALLKASEILSTAFSARGVLIATGGINVFGSPRVATPENLASWAVDTPLPKSLIGAPPVQAFKTEQPGEFMLTANDAVVAGFEWAGHAPLLIALLEPNANTLETINELLPALQSALERCELSEQLENSRSKLERQALVIRDMVYAFSHDLRTPLVANGINMRLALEGAFGDLPQEYKRTLVSGMEANEDLLALADSFLLLARLESFDLQPPVFQAVNLETAARSSASRLPKTIKIKWQVKGETSVLGNLSDLRRVIQNLLENAAKFSAPDQTIEVSLTRVNKKVRLEVADRGVGVASELEPRLFQRFSSGRVGGGGTGLGLYLARRIIEAHGGQIGYHRRVGGGSVFWLELAVYP
jgi:signal transduction histidine kinase